MVFLGKFSLISLISIFKRVTRFMDKENVTDIPHLNVHKAWVLVQLRS